MPPSPKELRHGIRRLPAAPDYPAAWQALRGLVILSIFKSWLSPMSQTSIPDFAETDPRLARSTLAERYGHDIRKTKIKTEGAPPATTDAQPDKSDLSPLFWGN